MSDEGSTESTEQSRIQVVRDSTFCRFIADEAVLSTIGRELEVGFLQYGPVHMSQTDFGEYETTNSKDVVTEVARMRTSYGAFLGMVMQFLQDGIVTGKLKSEAIKGSITQWAAELAERPDSAGEHRS